MAPGGRRDCGPAAPGARGTGPARRYCGTEPPGPPERSERSRAMRRRVPGAKGAERLERAGTGRERVARCAGRRAYPGGTPAVRPTLSPV